MRKILIIYVVIVFVGVAFCQQTMGNRVHDGKAISQYANKSNNSIPPDAVKKTIAPRDMGYGKLVNGTAYIKFSEEFKKHLVKGQKQPAIVITPMKPCNGIYISEVNKDGFRVMEYNNGKSNIDFKYEVVNHLKMVKNPGNSDNNRIESGNCGESEYSE